jgi:hypothetical protein
VQQPLGHRPVAEEHGGDGVATQHLVRQRAAQRDRHARGDDAVRAQHALSDVGHMHRPAPAPAGAGVFRQQFGEECVQFHALGYGMAVAAMGRGDGVCRGQRVHHAGGDSFLADRQVNEAGNQSLDQQCGQCLFGSPDGQHHAVETPQMRIVGGRLFGCRCCLPHGSDMQEFRMAVYRLMDIMEKGGVHCCRHRCLC